MFEDEEVTPWETLISFQKLRLKECKLKTSETKISEIEDGYLMSLSQRTISLTRRKTLEDPATNHTVIFHGDNVEQTLIC